MAVLERMKPFGTRYVSDRAVFSGIDSRVLFEAIAYLHGHGLVESLNQKSIDQIWNWGGVSLTPAGVDYLSIDGGLTEEAKTITVRFDADTLKALICNQVDVSEAAEEEKGKIKHAVRSLGNEGLKALTSELVKLGIQASPELVSWLGSALL